MTSLLVSAHFSIISLTNCTQIMPLFDPKSPARYSAYFFRMIHEILVVLNHDFGHPGREVI